MCTALLRDMPGTTRYTFAKQTAPTTVSTARQPRQLLLHSLVLDLWIKTGWQRWGGVDDGAK